MCTTKIAYINNHTNMTNLKIKHIYIFKYNIYIYIYL